MSALPCTAHRPTNTNYSRWFDILSSILIIIIILRFVYQQTKRNEIKNYMVLSLWILFRCSIGCCYCRCDYACVRVCVFDVLDFLYGYMLTSTVCLPVRSYRLANIIIKFSYVQLIKPKRSFQKPSNCSIQYVFVRTQYRWHLLLHTDRI